MKRFKCFNTIISSNNTTDDDEEEETNNEPEGENDTSSKDAATAKPTPEEKIEVVLPQVERMDSAFSDTGYWKVDPLEDNLDDLLADYE